MKTVIVNSVGARVGGAISYLNGILPRLAATEKYRFLVLVDEHAPMAGEPEGANVTVRRLRFRAGFTRAMWDQVGLPRMARKSNAVAILSLLNHGPRFAGIPQLILQRNGWYFTRTTTPDPPIKGLDLWTRRQLALATCRGSRIVIVPSAAMKADLESWLRHPRVAVLPHGLDTDFYASNTRNLDWLPHGLPQGEGPNIAYISHVASYKGHHDLLTAFRSMLKSFPGAQLALTIGSQDRRETGPRSVAEELSRAGRDLPGLHLLGEQQDRRVVRSLYEWADIIALPSRMESFGFPLLEAMAMAKPVVASALPALVELGEDIALFHASGDAEALSDHLERLAADPAARADRGKRGRERALSYGWDRYVPRLVALIDEAIGDDRVTG